MKKHPGKTRAQKRALDEMGCGNPSPTMSKKTKDSLLKDGLIEKCGERVIGSGPFAIVVDEWQMPVFVHYQWCCAVSVDEEE